MFEALDNFIWKIKISFSCKSSLIVLFGEKHHILYGKRFDPYNSAIILILTQENCLVQFFIIILTAVIDQLDYVDLNEIIRVAVDI